MAQAPSPVTCSSHPVRRPGPSLKAAKAAPPDGRGDSRIAREITGGGTCATPCSAVEGADRRFRPPKMCQFDQARRQTEARFASARSSSPLTRVGIGRAQECDKRATGDGPFAGRISIRRRCRRHRSRRTRRRRHYLLHRPPHQCRPRHRLATYQTHSAKEDRRPARILP